jgi:hypothetical protein
LASLVPPATTSNTQIARGVAPLTTTYSLVSSGEKQRPFGLGTSPVATVTFPVLPSIRYTLVGNSTVAG